MSFGTTEFLKKCPKEAWLNWNWQSFLVKMNFQSNCGQIKLKNPTNPETHRMDLFRKKPTMKGNYITTVTNWEKSILKHWYFVGFVSEQLRENEKQLRKTTRDVERDRRGLEREEQKVMAEIKKAAKANNKQGQPVDYNLNKIYFFLDFLVSIYTAYRIRRHF